MKLALIGCIAAVFLSGCMETIPKTQRSLSDSQHGYQIAHDNVKAGKQSQRFEVRAGDCAANDVWDDCKNDRERSEISYSPTGDLTMSQGSDTWISWSFYLPSDFVSSPKVATTLGQIHQKAISSAGPWMWVPPIVQIDVIGNSVYAGYGRVAYSETTKKILHRGEINPLTNLKDLVGKWNDVVLHFNSAEKGGVIEIFINGVLKTSIDSGSDFRPPNHQYYFKYGIYRSFVSRHGGPMPTMVAYFDEIRVGKTRMEVDPSINPNLETVD